MVLSSSAAKVRTNNRSTEHDSRKRWVFVALKSEMAKSSAPRLPRPGDLPKRTKTSRGATAAAETRLSIRSALRLAPELRTELREPLASKLSRYAREIERVSVRMLDVNGPKGGVDNRCRIKAVVSGRPSLIVEELATDPEEAFRLALPRLESALRRERGRRRAPVPRAGTQKSHRFQVQTRHRGRCHVLQPIESAKMNGFDPGRYVCAGARAYLRGEKVPLPHEIRAAELAAPKNSVGPPPSRLVEA